MQRECLFKTFAKARRGGALIFASSKRTHCNAAFAAAYVGFSYAAWSLPLKTVCNPAGR
jgi:hypothetical protein